MLGTKLCIGKVIREKNKVVVHAANGQSTTIFQDNLQEAEHLRTPQPGVALYEIFKNKYVIRRLEQSSEGVVTALIVFNSSHPNAFPFCPKCLLLSALTVHCSS